ncbi:MAG: hypothetical protein NT099_09320 [Candidatus Saganbacteria bacterium]|nr:hypothetical protein [Candidatus Saganbacteria bacterium]
MSALKKPIADIIVGKALVAFRTFGKAQGLALLSCLFILFLAFPSFADTARVQVLLDQASQDAVLAKFDLSGAKEAFARGENPRAKDLLQEVKEHIASLSDKLDSLFLEKGAIILDFKLTEQYEKAADAYQVLNQDIVELGQKIDAAVASGKKNMEVLADAGFVMNNRPQGSISSDRNLDGGVRINYLLDDASRLEFTGRAGFLQLLSNQTQNLDLGLNYFSKLGLGNFNAGLSVKPFTDTSNSANANTETRIALNYVQAIDDSSNVTIKGDHKIQNWANQNGLNYSITQVGAGYQNNLSATQTVLADGGIAYQGANTSSNQFSDLLFSAGYDEQLAKDQKWGSKLSFDGRSYPDSLASAYNKTGLNVNYQVGKLRYDVDLINNNAPSNATNSYWHYGIAQSFSQPLTKAINLLVKAGFLARNFQNQGSNYSKLDLQGDCNYVFADNQSIRLNDLLERTFYLTDTSSYLHNLFGLKYELQLYPGSAISLGERFTLDNYPSSWNQNATRNQLDLVYSWPILENLGGALTGGYELKNYLSPSSSQSDYNAYNLSLGFEHSFLRFGKANVALNYYQKVNAQNSSADTVTQNVTFALAYGF